MKVIVLFCLFSVLFQRQTVSLQPVPRIEDVLYHYKPIHVETYGPPVPELEQLGRLGYTPDHTHSVSTLRGEKFSSFVIERRRTKA